MEEVELKVMYRERTGTELKEVDEQVEVEGWLRKGVGGGAGGGGGSGVVGVV